MPVPEFQQFLLPVLRYAADGQEHRPSDTIESMERLFRPSEEDSREMIASGMPRFHNRVMWAITYLKKACVLESVSRGVFQITDRGRSLLSESPTALTRKTLERFPEFVEFTRKTGAQENQPENSAHEESATRTPEEDLEHAFRKYRKVLELQLLDRIKTAPPLFFEELVLLLLRGMGYGGTAQDAGWTTRRSGDDGIDGVIKEDPLGLDLIHIQAKRWTTQSVGRPDIQSFAGSLEGQRGRKGVFLTTSTFSSEARDYVSRIEKKIILIDGPKLSELCVEYGIGVSDRPEFRFKKLDESFFEAD